MAVDVIIHSTGEIVKLAGSYEPTPDRCGAKLRTKAADNFATRYCMAKPEPDRKRCKLHGGMTPRGVESPHWKGRGYSLDMPTHLFDKFRKAADDPHLTSLASEIALLDVRMGDLLSQLGTGESAEAWENVVGAHASLVDALNDDRVADLEYWIKELGEAITQAGHERAVWQEIYVLIDARRRTVDTERKREEMLSNNLTMRQAMTLVSAIQTAIIEEVHDAETRQRLGNRLAHLLGLADDHVQSAQDNVSKRLPAAQDPFDAEQVTFKRDKYREYEEERFLDTDEFDVER